MIAAPARISVAHYSEWAVFFAARVGVGNMATQQEPVDEPAGTIPFEFEVHEGAFTPSFMELYEQQYGAMVRLAVALTSSEATAEDLVQEAFVRVHARWDRIDLPLPYLRRAVVNACRSAGRRATRERTAIRDQLVPVSSLEADELFDALAMLSSRQRAALVLQFYEGLSQAEIAAVLGCREGTVASLVHRGLAQLRRVIER
jgi:RNA polymerase sigma-70 factor (sigma-E family)